jgi:sulfite exporter TauE/SafE
MIANDIVELFLGGLVLGHGPCLAFCAPIILPFVAGTEDTWTGGLKATLGFSAGRMLSYLFLALAASLSYAWLDNVILEDETHYTVRLVLSLTLLVLAALILLGHRTGIGSRGWLKGLTSGSPFVLGILVGLSPCAPLLASLAYIAVKAGEPHKGALMGLAFAVGTLLSPLLILGALSGSIKKLVRTSGKALLIFRILSAAVLAFYALRLGFGAFPREFSLLG